MQKWKLTDTNSQSGKRVSNLFDSSCLFIVAGMVLDTYKCTISP